MASQSKDRGEGGGCKGCKMMAAIEGNSADTHSSDHLSKSNIQNPCVCFKYGALKPYSMIVALAQKQHRAL